MTTMDSRRRWTARTARAALALLVGVSLPPGAAGAQIEPGPPRGRIVADTVPAPALAGNILGDPTIQPAWVYLPPGYDDAGKRYPVLYLLHGVLDDPSVWIEPVYQGMTIQATMDSLIEAGAVRPMIVVMPNGRNALGGSYYRNSPVTGGWGEFIARDVVRHVDAGYRTLASAGGRAIAGHSMGGLGAIWAGMLHPEVFSVVYGMNPCCLCCLTTERIPEQALTLDAYPSIDALWKELEQGNIWPLAVAGATAAFFPDPDRPPFYGDPDAVSEHESVVGPDKGRVYPASRVADRADALRSLKGLAFDSAFDDEFVHIPLSTAAFSDSLDAHGVPHVYEVYAGDHRNRMRERMATVVLPWISERLPDPVPEGAASVP
ncbi:MAG: alpha/beta hydrolase [Gemmatimonadota bacterium]